jgi:hypothetical protein
MSMGYALGYDLKKIREFLNIPVDAFLQDNKLFTHWEHPSGCGSGLDDEVRVATEVDKAYFILEAAIREEERKRTEEEERRKLAELKDKYERIDASRHASNSYSTFRS